MSTPDVSKFFEANEKKLHEVLEVEKSADWKLSKEDGDLKIFTRYVPDSSYSQLMSYISIPATIEAVVKNLQTIPKIEEGHPADGFAEKYVFAETHDDHDSKFYYYAVESGSRLVSNRDFINIRRMYKDGERYVFVTNAVDDDVKPASKKYVRGKIIFQAHIAEQDKEKPGNVKLTFLVHTDPAGSIPAAIYNMAIQKQGYSIKKIADACKNA